MWMLRLKLLLTLLFRRQDCVIIDFDSMATVLHNQQNIWIPDRHNQQKRGHRAAAPASCFDIARASGFRSSNYARSFSSRSRSISC
jgi:hypothetical protein